jgi:hypothetical protein
MRYLLNAVAADGSRFDDLKERFTFFGTDVPDAVAVEDWKARGITPIHYDARDRHRVLGETLEIWSRLSAVNGSERVLDAKIRRIVKFKRADANEVDRDLFDHLVRRGNAGERTRLARVAASASADLGWLDAITAIAREPARR